jgi:sortase (surface protein transpeptidase)
MTLEIVDLNEVKKGDKVLLMEYKHRFSTQFRFYVVEVSKVLKTRVRFSGNRITDGVDKDQLGRYSCYKPTKEAIVHLNSFFERLVLRRELKSYIGDNLRDTVNHPSRTTSEELECTIKAYEDILSHLKNSVLVDL